MTEPIVLDTSVSDLEQSNAMWEAIDAVCGVRAGLGNLHRAISGVSA